MKRGILYILLVIGMLFGYAINTFFSNNVANHSDPEIQKVSVNFKFDKIRNQNLGALIGELIHLIDLDLDSMGKVSDKTIHRIEVASTAFHPYYPVANDSLSELLLSPERGLLLTMIIASDIDSISFDQIKRQVTFQYADLKDADLSGVGLGDINLDGARFTNVKAVGTDFSRANLRYVDFSLADVSHSIFNHADLNHASFHAVKADHASFREAKMNGVNFDNARLRFANFTNSVAEWSNFSHALASRVSFKKTRLKGAVFFKAVLNGASFDLSEVSKVALTDSQIDSSSWDSALVASEDWMAKEFATTPGVDQLKLIYEAQPDSDLENRFRLVKKKR